MKASELKQIIEDLMLRYGDLDIIFKDEYNNATYEIKDVMLSFSKGEDKYIITNHYYEQKNCILSARLGTEKGDFKQLMFNKRLLVSIILDKKKLKEDIKGSCNIECIPTIKLLNKEEYNELRECLNKACDLLRKSYIRSLKQ